MSKLQVSVQHGILETENLERIPVGSEDWFKWLEKNRSFRFECDGQGFSARKENPLKKSASDTGYGEPEYDEANAYWSAYRKVNGKTRKRYIGKTATLTQERLIEISKALDEPSAPKPEKELPIRLGDSEVTELESRAWRAQSNYEHTLEQLKQLEAEVAKLHNNLGDYQTQCELQKAELHKELGDLRERCATLDAENFKLHELNGELNNKLAHLPDQQPEPTAPALELPNAFDLLQRLRAEHPLFNGKKPKCEIKDKDVAKILELLEEML